MKVTQRFVFLVTVLLLVAGLAFGQGTTGSISGAVTHEGAPLPGVTITISSPALQGARVGVSNVNGDYNFPALPPGDYTVRFEMEGMANVTKSMRVGLGSVTRANAALQLSSMAVAITVTATASTVVAENNEVQTNFGSDLVQELPLNRTFQSTANLAPGVTTNSPNANQLVISGAPASESLYLVNGAVVNENVRSQIHNLFIEEAIEEQTVMTGSISAEYGRFSGGVVTAITKSGGNEFSGSLRDNFTNPDWTKKTPLASQPDPLDTLNEVYEVTLGGRVVRDRLWFFVAGRYFDTQRDSFLKQAGGNTATPAFTVGQTNERYEVKLTGQITPKHQLIGSYLDNTTEDSNNCFLSCYEFSNIDVARTLPNDFITARYSGILTSNLLVEAGYSKKKFAFEGSGGDFRDFANGTWGYDLAAGGFFGAPVFCGVCDAESRDNENVGLKATYYLATAGAGTHNFVVGYDDFAEQRLANNYQSGSDFEIYVYTSPTRGADGTILPNISEGDLIQWTPILALSRGSDLATQSLFLNDAWDLNNNFSFNLGVRYDQNDSRDSSGNKTSDDSAFSPRLGMTYDIKGDGRFRVNAGYARYVSHVQETIAGSGASGAGNPAYFGYYYLGDDISGLPTPQAFALVDQWFQANGGVSNVDLLAFVGVPGLNTVIQESLTSPNTDEFTVGFGTQIGSGGYFRTDFIDREYKDFYSRRVDLTTGDVAGIVELPDGTELDLGRFDLQVYENGDDLKRTYQAILLQGGYRVGQNLSLGANYTWSETKGNFTPETSGSGPVPDTSAQYPEYKAFAQNNPGGFIAGVDQEHKARLWATFNLGLNAFGNMTFGLLQNYDSATPFSDVGTIRTRNADGTPWITNPGYNTPPSSVTYYFSDRGAHRWEDQTSTDLSLTYDFPIKGISLWAKADLLNAFDEDAQVGGNTTILTASSSSCRQLSNGPTPNARCLDFNPLVGQVPVEGIHFRRGGSYGAATSTANFQLPQTYRFSVGLRF